MPGTPATARLTDRALQAYADARQSQESARRRDLERERTSALAQCRNDIARAGLHSGDTPLTLAYYPRDVGEPFDHRGGSVEFDLDGLRLRWVPNPQTMISGPGTYDGAFHLVEHVDDGTRNHSILPANGIRNLADLGELLEAIHRDAVQCFAPDIAETLEEDA